MFLFTPRYLKHGRQFIKDARKLVAYKRDLVSEETLLDVEREISHLEHAVEEKDPQKVNDQMRRLDEACGKLTKPAEDAAWRENVEVFLVAIVIALAVRTYFLQPFTIPTGSMQPTLNGIIVTRDGPPPGVARQVVEQAVYGRRYINVIAKDDESILTVKEVKRFFFFTYCELHSSKENMYLVHATFQQMSGDGRNSFGVQLPQEFKKGEPIAQGYIETGDHVFVDKFSYHFVRPKRDEVFVFSTKDIAGLKREGQQSQYYIKRLAGLPNDDLRIVAPELLINGERAKGPGFERVMAGRYENREGFEYRGYQNSEAPQANYLRRPDEQFHVEPKNYFALGDNSYNSADSRYWGTVPQENIAGRALFVYYPFTRHFGLIK
jgi:signal peptidase I